MRPCFRRVPPVEWGTESNSPENSEGAKKFQPSSEGASNTLTKFKAVAVVAHDLHWWP